MSVHDRSSFESIYAGQPRWEIGRPQKVFLDVADRITGSILDSGCGTGENALFFASRGQKVTGIDFLAEPIQRAKQKAAERGLTATFLVMDALALKELPEVFDSVIDSGLFHVFGDEDRHRCRKLRQQLRSLHSTRPGPRPNNPTSGWPVNYLSAFRACPPASSN